MNQILARLLNWLQTATPAMKFYFAIGSALMGFFGWLSATWGSLFAKIDTLIAPAMPSGFDFAPLGLLNYCFPVDTLLNYVVALGALKITCTGIRMIKAFVPTVA